MPRQIHNVYQNFAAGVLSPRYSARVDSEAFRHALAEGDNFIISSQGGAVFREGHEHLNFAINNSPSRVFQFLRGGEISDLMIEVSTGASRFWLDGEPYQDLSTLLTDEADAALLVDEADGINLAVGTVVTVNPYSTEDLDTIYFSNQDKYGVMCQGNHPPLYITLRKDGSILSELFAPFRIPKYNYRDVNSPALGADQASWTLNFPANWQNYNFRYQVLYAGVEYPQTFIFLNDAGTNALNIENGLNSAAAIAGLSATFTVTPLNQTNGLGFDIAVAGADSGRKVEVRPEGGGTFIPIQTPPLVQEGNTEGKDEPVWSYPLYVLGSDGNYYQCIRTHLSVTATDPTLAGNDIYWVNLGIGKPAGFDYQYPGGNAWTDAANTIYSPMDRGFPTVCEFHQQRLILMANKDNPTALYGSEINGYFNFIPGPNDDEPWIFVLDSSDSPQIKWANSDRNLMLGTSNGEWLISADVTITPTDISAERQNAARSHLTRPVQVDTQVFYIEQGLRKLRGTQYVRNRNSNVSSYVSIGAENLIATDGIKRIVVQHVPEVMMTMVTTKGQVVTLNYEQSQGIVAFTPWITDGTIYDVCALFTVDFNRDDTYFCVQRNGNWIIEKMRYPCSKLCDSLSDKGVVYMDGWVTGDVIVDSLSGAKIISGLGHLEGKEVYVLIDDAWQIGTFIVTGGVVSLPSDSPAGVFAAGLPYTGNLETFEMEDNFQGTGLGTKRRWVQLTTRVLNSALPLIETKRDRDRTPATLMSTAETARLGLQDITQTTMGYGDGKIHITHDKPYPLHVIAFFGEYQVEER